MIDGMNEHISNVDGLLHTPCDTHLEQLPLCILGDYTDIFRRLEPVQHANTVWMRQLAQDGNLLRVNTAPVAVTVCG